MYYWKVYQWLTSNIFECKIRIDFNVYFAFNILTIEINEKAQREFVKFFQSVANQFPMEKTNVDVSLDKGK